MVIPVADPTKQSSEEEIHEKLSKLPGALFEEVVFHFDQVNIVPPREASQVIRAIELVKLARSRANGIKELWEFLQSKINTSHQMKINELIGILMPPEDEESEIAKEIARYAFAQLKNSIISDIFSNPDEGIISTLVWNLENLSTNSDSFPEILAFAVLCHDHAEGLGRDALRKQLEDWIEEACVDTAFSLKSIRALYPRQDYSRLHRLSIEIAWDESIRTIGEKSLQMEAYIRWGRLRQRINQFNITSDVYKEITRLFESIKEIENTGIALVDHAELVLDPMEMHFLWEYKDGLPSNIDNPEWQQFPIVVRSYQRDNHPNPRACPKHTILSEHIACNKHGREQFLARIQDHGVFTATKYESENGIPCRIVRDAISWASIGIWSREVFDDDNQLLDLIKDQQIEDIPRRIHNRRKISGSESIWRNVVVLYDPNLPSFKFSHELRNPVAQHRANKGLK